MYFPSLICKTLDIERAYLQMLQVVPAVLCGTVSSCFLVKPDPSNFSCGQIEVSRTDYTSFHDSKAK